MHTPIDRQRDPRDNVAARRALSDVRLDSSVCPRVYVYGGLFGLSCMYIIIIIIPIKIGNLIISERLFYIITVY